MSRPVIATFLGGYLPGYRFGGPSQSIANLVDRLGDEFDFRIVTADRDLGAITAYPNVPPLTWVPVGKARVLYVPPADRQLAMIGRLLRDTAHDAVYLNSFFDPRFSTLPLIARKLRLAPQGPRVIMAPRGEFSAGALRIKPTRKRAFLQMSRVVGLHRNVIWQASTEREAQDIRQTISPSELYCATDLPRRPAPLLQRDDPVVAEPLRIVFLSRISPMKNLLFALQVLANVSAHVVFTIHGPREDTDYWRQCSDVIATLPLNIKVVDGGPIKPIDVVPALARHDVFFLPTLGENYGHVISEALEAGLRLLISDRTPWRGLVAEGVGYDLPLDTPTAFARAIEIEAARTDRIAAAARSYAYLSRAFRTDEVIAANRTLLLAATQVVPRSGRMETGCRAPE